MEVFSRIVVILVVLSVPFSPFCLTSLFFHFLGFPFGGDLSFILSVYYGSLYSVFTRILYSGEKNYRIIIMNQ